MSSSELASSIAVDAMGGDNAPEVVVRGALCAHKAGVPVTLVGDEVRIRALLPDGATIAVEHASQVIEMHEPALAIRRKPDASLRRCVDLVAEGRCAGAVGFGNSGAFLLASVLALRLLDGAQRPALATEIPRADGGQLILLDAGANVDCRAEHLASFARMGAAYAHVCGYPTARIGLLSNGEEDGKGNALVREAHGLLSKLGLNYVGNIEPQHAMAGECDVLVCDGFTGNVMLKGVEAAVSTSMILLKSEIRRSPSARAGAALLAGALKRFGKRVAWDEHGGGIVLGIAGVVVLGHGRSNERAVEAGIRKAWTAVQEGLVPALETQLNAQSA